MKTLSILFAAAFAASALASQVATPTRLPAGMTLKHIYATIGANGVGHLTDGPTAQAATPRALIYGAWGWSGWYYNLGLGVEVTDLVPLPSQSCIDMMQVVYICGGDAGSKGTLNLNFYDYSDITVYAPVQFEGCQTIGTLANGWTVANVPTDGAYIITINFAAGLETLLGHSHFGWSITNYNGTVNLAPGTGPIIITNGDADAAGLGKAMKFDFSNVPGGWSFTPGLSADDEWWSGGCYWNGDGDQNNTSQYVSFYGKLPWMYQLSGDYGINGPTYDGERNKVWLSVSNGTTTDLNLMTVYTNPTTLETWGGVPFGGANSGPFDIKFMKQDGYLSETAVAQTPNLALAMDCTPVTYVFNLRGGDANGDNAVNLVDLGVVLTNFNQVGN
jgi:hypothetical protein